MIPESSALLASEEQKPAMSIESDQEMLHFVDDPTLFEFNECNNEYAEMDRYESAPVPLDWQQAAQQELECGTSNAPADRIDDDSPN